MHVNRDNLRHLVESLAAVPRPAESAELERARDYVSAQLTAAGWNVEPFPFQAVGEIGETLNGVNLIARHERYFDDALPRFVLGAHLDSRPESPGADDNASAVAAMLEIARLLPQVVDRPTAVSLELVAFDLEENGMLGGARHAGLMRANNINLAGMVSLEMLGYCDASPNSQALPRSLVGLYPDTGDFIAVIGNQNSEALAAAFGEGMKRVDDLPVETLLVPDNGNQLQATRLSDHSPFWDAGYPALMITDTSFLRNPHYHTAGDTPDTLDWQFLKNVTEGALLAMRDIIHQGV